MVRYQVPRPDLGRVLRVARRETISGNRMLIEFRRADGGIEKPDAVVCAMDAPEANVLLEESALFDAQGLPQLSRRFYPARRVVGGWLAILGDQDSAPFAA